MQAGREEQAGAGRGRDRPPADALPLSPQGPPGPKGAKGSSVSGVAPERPVRPGGDAHHPWMRTALGSPFPLDSWGRPFTPLLCGWAALSHLRLRLPALQKGLCPPKSPPWGVQFSHLGLGRGPSMLGLSLHLLHVFPGIILDLKGDSSHIRPR